jgi:uncharacterized protein YrzB (UPF0473 family)
MDLKPDEILFTTEDGGTTVFKVLEQTRLGGVDYLLVSTTQEEEDEEALILKDVSKETDEVAVYDIVEDDKELDMVAGIFRELLEDIELL